ncbi:MAG: RsmB/NOP family class I SAM-dependent RNA methyltransferase [Bacteroidota bacterium]
MLPEKIHFPQVNGIVQCLYEIFEKNFYADKVIERVLKSNPRWGSHDRAFIAETTYDIVRWWRLLNESVNQDYETETKSLLNIVSAYLWIFHGRKNTWNENGDFNFEKTRERFEKKKDERKFLQSVPDWLDEKGVKELGEEKWEKEIAALNEQADVVLRVNTLKTNKAELKKILLEENCHTGELTGIPDALVLKQRKNIFRSAPFLDGLFEVQDAGSQMIAPFMRVEPGWRVVDACAGAGGKTLHIASLMKNKGRIVALDIYQNKLDELKKRAARAGVFIVEPKLIDSSKVIKRLQESCDRLLLDVPCSGLGTLRRNPDAKWKLGEEFIEKVKQQQREILQNYSKMLKPGGMMVYATCSIFPSENEEQVNWFLSENTNFEKVEEKKIFPSEGFDGFYMCLMKRKS